MLKSNSSSGKLDILITDESLFGTGKKGTHKSRVVTRQSHFQGKQPNKPAIDKVPKGRDIKQPKPVKREAKTRKEKTARPLSVSKSKPHDHAGVISKTHLDNILLLLNTEGASNGKEFSPADHLESQWMTSLGKNRTTDFKGNNKEVCVKPDDYIVDAEGKEARNDAVPREIEKKDREKDNQTSNTVQADTKRKKLKWKKELDEQVLFKTKAKEKEKQDVNNKGIEEYDPWGRPGGGAPIKSQSGKVLANYQNRPAVSKNEFPKDGNNAALLVPSCHASSTVSQSRSSPVSKVASNTRDINTTLPVAMRSSFAIGAPGLVAHDTQRKRLQEIQWKQELQKQIQEKKERERIRKVKEAQEDLPNLSLRAKQHLDVVLPPRTTDVSSQVSELYGKNPGQDVPVQSTQDHLTPVHQVSLNGGLETHARGFGMQLMDPQAEEEAAKKRLKMLEHQLAIKEQVEEKRRLKQLEREQRLRDEAIEDARLAEEREKFNKVFVMEQKHKRGKEAKTDNRRRHLGATEQDIRSKLDTVVPPLDLADRNSPPIPTLRNKINERYELTSPKSSGQVYPAGTNRSLHRNVSSHSEPCDASFSSKRDPNASDVGSTVSQCDNLSNSKALYNDREFNRPFSVLEDTFMIPFRRSDSATLPAPPETPEPVSSHGVINISPRTMKRKEVNTQTSLKNVDQSNGKTVMPHRTVHSHFKPKGIEPEVPTRGAKGSKNIKDGYLSQSTKAAPSTRTCSKERDLKKSNNTQQRRSKTFGGKTSKEQVTPKNDVSFVLSAQQVLPVPLQTARQELILQQLAALRQGLALKERELKQDTM